MSWVTPRTLADLESELIGVTPRNGKNRTLRAYSRGKLGDTLAPRPANRHANCMY